MSTNWYYQCNDAQRGPISGSALRRLAVKGEITRETRVRPADSDSWVPAGNVQGLFRAVHSKSSTSQPSTQNEPELQWFLRDVKGKVYGPITKRQLDDWFKNGQIVATSQIRIKKSGPWQRAADFYPSLDRAGIRKEQVFENAKGAWRRLSAYSKNAVGGLSVTWSPAPPHLRRCFKNLHHQFSAHDYCTKCGLPTVGIDVEQVMNGDDERLQDVYSIWKKGNRLTTRIITCTAVVGVIISIALILTTWWSIILVPVVLALGVAVPYFAVGLQDVRIQSRLAQSAERSYRYDAEAIDKINNSFIVPFLRRNEITEGSSVPDESFLVTRLKSLDTSTSVLVNPAELQMLEEVLEKNEIVLWGTQQAALIVLSAFALKSDYELFKHRLESLESAGWSIVEAYASLVRDDESLLPFLQQLLVEKQLPEDATTLLSRLKEVRHELKLHGFAKDLEQRRHGSMSLTIEIVDRMNPFNFELLLGMIYETLGYRFIETPKTGDQGADVLLEKAGERTVIQAKLYSENVGNKAVQEAISAKVHFRCHTAKVVTNSQFTPSAIELANSSGVQLVDRDELRLMIEEFNKCPKDYVRLEMLMVSPASPIPEQPSH